MSNAGVIVKAATSGATAAHTANNLDSAAVVVQNRPLAAAAQGQRDFAASEYPIPQRRPVLYVTYVVP
jgi:hypothetical protein